MNGRFFFTSLGLVAALATALVYGVGGSLAIDGVLTVGTLTALAGLLGQLYGPLTQLTNLRIDVMNALVSFDRVFEVLDLEPVIRDRADAVPVSGPPSVAFDHVSFTYPSAAEVSLASLESIASLDQRPNTEVLHDVSFAVAPGADRGAGRPLRRRQDDDDPPDRPALRRELRHRLGGRHRRTRAAAGVAARRGRLRHPGRPHVPRHHRATTCATPART